MNLYKRFLLWRLRFKAHWIEAQLEHAMQLSETYHEEAQMLDREYRKVQRQIFASQTVREITYGRTA